jgi:hypothetical protein
MSIDKQNENKIALEAVQAARRYYQCPGQEQSADENPYKTEPERSIWWKWFDLEYQRLSEHDV